MGVQQDSQQEKILPISKKEGREGNAREAVADGGGSDKKAENFSRVERCLIWAFQQPRAISLTSVPSR